MIFFEVMYMWWIRQTIFQIMSYGFYPSLSLFLFLGFSLHPSCSRIFANQQLGTIRQQPSTSGMQGLTLKKSCRISSINSTNYRCLNGKSDSRLKVQLLLVVFSRNHGWSDVGVVYDSWASLSVNKTFLLVLISDCSFHGCRVPMML